MRLTPAVLLLSLAVAAGTPSASDAQTPPARVFTAVPCPTAAWRMEDPVLTSVPGVTTRTGRYEGGLYAIEVPDNWNGDLILYAHGQRELGSPQSLVLNVTVPALRRHWLERGFAWAASSYRCNGTVYGIGLTDTLALRDLVVAATGGRAPRRTILVGHSLGGRITMLGIREFPDVFAGGLAMCPVGPETWDARVAIAEAAAFITGIRPSTDTLPQDLARMSAVLGTSPNYTAKGAQLASVQVALTGGPRPFALEGLTQRYLDNVRVGFASAPAEPLLAAGNLTATYAIAPGLGLTAETLNQAVRRRAPDTALSAPTTPYRELLPFDGALTRPLMTLHGTGDLQVFVSQEQAFRRAVDTAGTNALFVQRLMRIPGHCQFSDAEEQRAFDDLVAWLDSGTRPPGDDVLGDLSDAGLTFTTPLRPGDPGNKTVRPPTTTP